MLLRPATVGWSATSISTVSANPRVVLTPPSRLWRRALLNPSLSLTCSSAPAGSANKPPVLLRSLKLLEWDKVCDAVASFAGTPLGREATKALLGMPTQTYEESLKLLAETSAAVEIIRHGGGSVDFSGIDVALVKSAVMHVRQGLPVDGNEAMAVVALLQFSSALKHNIGVAMKEDANSYKHFAPLSEMIMKMVINQSVITAIQKVVDEDGSVKDSASPTLKIERHQVQVLEEKIYQLMSSLISNEASRKSFQEMSSIDGRLFLKFNNDQPTNLKGLLLSSHSGEGTLLEPLVAVPLNDHLQQARAAVANAELEVLLMLTEKIKGDIDEIEELLFDIIKLDAINARATFSISLEGTCPDLVFLENRNGLLIDEDQVNRSAKVLHPIKSEWMLCLLKAYHPLLLWQHHLNLQKSRNDLKNATAAVQRRKMLGENMPSREEMDLSLSYLKMQVSELEHSHPVPIDFFIAHRTKVLVISGPNAGGKTICLKTVGLAAMMAKSGLYVLASEPVRIPWFDYIFADIGDEQSLSQSLSTFSGHLKQISDIQAESTFQSLVLLDEVGAGTNPLEGSALGMSLLEYFSKAASLTISTTHLGELKTLKYRNEAFENACMEFDEVNMKPTYKLLLGIPGCSNAISIAERLGLPRQVLDHARELHGSTSTNINAVIIGMERSKQEFLEHYRDAQQNLRISREVYEKLLATEKNLIDRGIHQRRKKSQIISDLVVLANSVLRRKLREHGSAAATQLSTPNNSLADNLQQSSATACTGEPLISNKNESSDASTIKGLPSGRRLPRVGDTVQLSSIRKKGRVLKVDPSKEELVVEAGSLRLKVKLRDVAV